VRPASAFGSAIERAYVTFFEEAFGWLAVIAGDPALSLRDYPVISVTSPSIAHCA